MEDGDDNEIVIFDAGHGSDSPVRQPDSLTLGEMRVTHAIKLQPTLVIFSCWRATVTVLVEGAGKCPCLVADCILYWSY